MAGVSRAEQLGASLDSLFAQLAKRPALSAGLDIAIRGTSDSLQVCEQRFRKMLELSDGQPQSAGPYLITTDYKNSDVSEYRGWLADADIGLFLYDREAYRHRASGMFLEMLSLGVPIIVPDQTTMGSTLDSLMRDVGQLPLGSGDVNVEHSDDRTFRFQVQTLDTNVRCEFSVPNANSLSAYYAEVTNETGSRFALPLYYMGGSQMVLSLPIECLNCAVHINILSSDNGAQRPLPHQLTKCTCHASNSPMFAVGCKFLDGSRIADLIAEVANNLQHYRMTAKLAAARIRELHDPVAVYDALVR